MPSSVNLGTQQLQNANKFMVGKLQATGHRDIVTPGSISLESLC